VGIGRRRGLIRSDSGAVGLEEPADDLDSLSKLVAQAAAITRGTSGGSMTPWELPIVVDCRQLLANTVAQLPLVAVKSRQVRPDQPRLTVQPDPDEPRWMTFYRMVNNLTGWGHVWLLPTAWGADGWPMAVRVVDAHAASPMFDSAGRLESVQYGERSLTPGPDGMVWVPWDVSYRGDPGRSPIAGCWRAAQYLAALYEMAGSFWEAGFPSFAIQVPVRLTPTQLSEMKSKLIGRTARRHEPLIVDSKAEVAPVGANAVESQLVESIATANMEIARAFGCLPSLVNVEAGGSLTYATTESEFRKWIITGLQAYLIRVEAAFDQLLPYGTSSRFATDELLRSDGVTRASFYSAGLTDGWLTVDEVRDREGLPPIGGAGNTGDASALAGDATATGGGFNG
jgi:HK97 family phage portal protein